jgi:hypothetical protein
MFPRFISWILASALVLTAFPVVAQQSSGRSTFETAQTHRQSGSSGDLPLQFAPAMQFSTGGNAPQGVAVGDFNGDGKPDLVVANLQQNNVVVLLGNGDGTFGTPIVHSLPNIGVLYGVAVADFNGDGKLDVAVVHGSTDYLISDVEILLGNGDGTLGAATAFPSGTDAVTIVTADLNGDGKPDVIVGGAGPSVMGHGGNLSVLFGNGDGTLQPAIPLDVPGYMGGLWSAAVGDFNGDGRLDIVAAQVGPMAGIAVFLQNPDHSFTLGATYQTLYRTGVGVAVADLNNDGKLDVVLTSNMGTATTFLGNGDGTFQSPIPTFSGNFTEFLALADFNRDGNVDVAFADYSPTAGPGVLAAAGLGTGNFSTSNTVTLNTAGGTRVVAVADFNGDGWPDIVSADAVGNKVSVFLNLTGVDSGALQFVPVTPCRLVDTRPTFGGAGPITGGTAVRFILPQLAQTKGCASLSSAAAYSLNVTVVPQHVLSYLIIWPTGEMQPGVSTLNSLDGRIKADAATVVAGANGAVSVYVTETTNVILDIDGYYAPPSFSTLAFYPMAPCRVADTRKSNPIQGLGTPHLSGGVPRDFPVLLSSCNIPTTAQAYSLNFTAVPYPTFGDPLDYLEVWPTGQRPQHPVSTLNNFTGTIVANAAIVPAGTTGDITALASNDTDLVIDINGYFAPAGTGGLSLYAVTPCRVLDTRLNHGQPFMGTLSPPVDVEGSPCTPPPTAQAYVLNATVVPVVSLSYLTLWPDLTARPLQYSTLNAIDGAITSNMAIVGTTNGKVNAYATSLTQLVLDISAYFAP